jgi:hypothetical protein
MPEGYETPTSQERAAKRKAKQRALAAALLAEQQRLYLIASREPATRPLVPMCKPVTAEEAAQVVRKLWGGVDPVGNGWAAYPTPTAGGMGDGKSGNSTATAGADEERWAAFIAKRASEGASVTHRLG